MDRDRLDSMLMSEQEWFARELENLELCDVDYVVDVLGITTDELITAFYGKVKKFLKEEYEIVNGTFDD